MNIADVEKELKKRKVVLLKKDGFKVTTRHLYIDENNYCYCMSNCATVTRKWKDLVFQTGFMDKPSAVVDALLIKIGNQDD